MTTGIFCLVYAYSQNDSHIYARSTTDNTRDNIGLYMVIHCTKKYLTKTQLLSNLRIFYNSLIFADDTNLFDTSKSVKNLNRLVNCHMKHLNNWIIKFE